MAIFYANNNNDNVDLFNEAADYVIGCINEEYEIDEDLLKESAEYVLNEISEKRANKILDKQAKAGKSILNSFANKPIKNKEFSDEEKKKFMNIHKEAIKRNLFNLTDEWREEAVKKIMDNPKEAKKMLRYAKKGARQAKHGKYTEYNDMI